MKYYKLFLMLAISFVIMYTVMFLNVFSISHVYLSITRTYMALLMIAPMAVLMMLMMRKMYDNKRLNKVIMGISIIVFISVLILLRTQSPVEDEQYMKAMISHHSSAILTSENADIQDPELKQLAEQIIVTQEKEIKQMKGILDRFEKNIDTEK